MTVKTAFEKVGQHSIRYLEAGSSEKTIILLHGLGASAERWLPIIPYLSVKYRIIAPDIIGFGYSDKPIVEYTMKFFTKFLSDFVDRLFIKTPIVIGSSLGGRILIEYAIHHPQNIEKIILVSPAINTESSIALNSYIQAALHPTFDDAKKALSAMAGNHSIDDDFVKEFINRKLPNSKMAFLASLMGLKKSILTNEQLGRLVNPTLLIWGKEDQVIPIANAAKLNGSVKNLQYHIMDGCGHTPFAEKPELFSKIVLDFLK